jgi:colanic acid biosynthesis glycosyl transferase WcaI
MHKILLIAGNYFPEPTGIGKYNGEMINWLAAQGHSCTVITTFPYYPQWKTQSPYEKRKFWYKKELVEGKDSATIKIIRCPHYVPKNPSGIYRLISEFTFFISAYLVVLYFLFKKKFDYTINVAPPFEIGLLGVIYKKIRGGKLLYHVQDLQIDAARDLCIIKQHRVINFLFSVEKYIMKNTDFISTISEGMIEKVKHKCGKNILYFPNWVDTDLFHPIQNKQEIKSKYGFKSSDKVILYSGAIGHKQGLEMVLDSAKMLEYYTDIKFAICGGGPYKNRLMTLAAEMDLKNVVFLPLVPTEELNSLLNMADMHLVVQKNTGNELFFPSKLSTILAVGGIAIVTAAVDSSLYRMMSSDNMGILIQPENKDEFVSAIIDNIYSDQNEEKSLNARGYAEKYLHQDNILLQYFKDFSFTHEQSPFVFVTPAVTMNQGELQ